MKMADKKSRGNEEFSKLFYGVIKRVIVSEKATRLIEFENKLVFEIVKNADRSLIKTLVEKEFDKKVKSVNIIKSIDGKKRAIVTFAQEGVASELSSELGLI